MVLQEVTHHEDEALFLGQSSQLLSFLGSESERLFHKDILARLQ